jgi:hypothetical protein
LGQHIILESRKPGISLLCPQASPHNHASVKNLLHLGFQPDHTLTKYGAERLLFYLFN